MTVDEAIYAILHAVYGEEVRTALAEGLRSMNTEVQRTDQSRQMAVQAAAAASTSAENAAASELAAGNSASSASTSATNADASEENAEAWAIGKRDGVDVPSTDPTYQNNSKYYAQQANTAKVDAVAAKNDAETAQTAAQGSATDAAASEKNSEAWAVGKRDGTDVPSTDPAYQNNSKYYMQQAAIQAGYSSHPPIIGQNDNWWLWSGSDYADSGIYARGVAGEITGATAQSTTLQPNQSATASVTPGGTTTQRTFQFDFGIPKGEPGDLGPFGFYIDNNGHLIMEYEGNTPPNAQIDSNGHLILTLGTTSVDVGNVKGPNLINNTTETSLTGILKGNGSTIEVQPVDSTPTINSDNPISSDGTKKALDKLKATTINPNLLDNWYFVGGGSQQGGGQFPINQRGQTIYTGNVYTIDRYATWSQSGNQVLSIQSGYIEFTSGSFFGQIGSAIENFHSIYAGKELTFSVLFAEPISSNDWFFRYQENNDDQRPIPLNSTFFQTTFTVIGNKNNDIVNIICRNGSSEKSCKIIAVKLELGDTQTLAHNEGTDANPVWVLNEIPNYQQELAKCQRYYVRYSGTSDLPSLALGYILAANSAVLLFYLPTCMAKTHVNISCANLRIYDGTTNRFQSLNASGSCIGNIAADGATINGGTVGSVVRAMIMSDGYIDFSAEL